MTRLWSRVRAAGERVRQLMPGQRRTLRTARWWLLVATLYMAWLIANPIGDGAEWWQRALTFAAAGVYVVSVHWAYQRDAVVSVAVAVATAAVRQLRPDVDGALIDMRVRGHSEQFVIRLDPPA